MTGSRRNPTRRLASAAVAAVVMSALILLPTPAVASCHVVNFSQNNYNVGEGDGKVVITINRQIFGAGCPGHVEWNTDDGTATHPADYTQTTGRHNFVTTTESSASFEVPIKEDSLVEGNEQFKVMFTGQNAGQQSGSATVTIIDNDEAAAPPPQSSPTQPRQSPAAEPTESPTPDEEATPQDDDSPSPGGALEFGEEAATQTVEDDGGGLPTAAVVSILGVLIAAGAAIGLWLLQRRKAAAAE